MQCAGTFAKTILRAYATADLRQRIGLVRKLGRFEQFALLDQLQPVRNVIVHRAFPLAVGIAAGQTAAGLCGRRRTVVVTVDLAVVTDALFGGFLVRIAARYLEKLQRMLRHYAARLSDSISEPSSAAFGFTTQNFGRKLR